MSSSGLIYALIVGAWAVYLVPIWLRREDELNAAREMERFTTAIRVLGHRDAAARRAVGDDVVPDEEPGTASVTAPTVARGAAPDGGVGRDRRPAAARAARAQPGTAPASAASRDDDVSAAELRARRSRGRLVARRRRVVATLLALSLVGVIATAALGAALLWLTGVPGALFVAYAVHVRHDERRRVAEREARHHRIAVERRRARVAETAARAEAERAAAVSGRRRLADEPVFAVDEPAVVRAGGRPLRPVAGRDAFADRPRAVGE